MCIFIILMMTLLILYFVCSLWSDKGLSWEYKLKLNTELFRRWLYFRLFIYLFTICLTVASLTYTNNVEFCDDYEIRNWTESRYKRSLHGICLVMLRKITKPWVSLILKARLRSWYSTNKRKAITWLQCSIW